MITYINNINYVYVIQKYIYVIYYTKKYNKI